MKKLVLALVCAVLMTVFISFNYLLWDKEQNTKSIKNLEYSNENKDATIDALGRDIKNLQDSSRELSSKMQTAENYNKELQKKNEELIQKQLKIEELLKRKSSIIDALKQLADLKPLESVIKKWAESIDKGEYENAYKLEVPHFKENGESISLDEYSQDFKNNIKSMKIKSLKLSDKETTEKDTGDIVFVVVLDVKKHENSGENKYNDGLNERYFSITYDNEKSDWVIAGISITQ